MHHPFELDLPALKAIESTLTQSLADEEAETIQGGRQAVSQTLTAPRPPSESGEDGGGVMTTMAVGEEGGTYTTLALGEEGGDHSCLPTVNLPGLPSIVLPSFPPF
jgi:hypothetical protein